MGPNSKTQAGAQDPALVTLITTNYDMFVFMPTNRDVDNGHVRTLTEVYKEDGNLTRVEPVVVNERMEVIDGQHNIAVCKELDLPVYYRVVPGLRSRDARSMNIHHKPWKPLDYAKSYANDGNTAYQRYLQLREDFSDIAHRTILVAIAGTEIKGLFRDFRDGDLVLSEKMYASARAALTHLQEIGAVIKGLRINHDSFWMAMLKLTRSSAYDPERMTKKLALFGPEILVPMSSVEDNLRMLEEIYNYKSSTNRVRLY